MTNSRKFTAEDLMEEIEQMTDEDWRDVYRNMIQRQADEIGKLRTALTEIRCEAKIAGHLKIDQIAQEALKP